MAAAATQSGDGGGKVSGSGPQRKVITGHLVAGLVLPWTGLAEQANQFLVDEGKVNRNHKNSAFMENFLFLFS